jgi:hypothetical protein
MSQRRQWTVASLFVVMCVIPRPASANLWDLIWEMSGPQMIGFRAECRHGFDGTFAGCRIPPGFPIGNVGARTNVRTWLALEGGLYVSTGKNADDPDVDEVEFEFGDAFMIAFEPMIEVRSTSWMHHGVLGVSYDFFLGPDFRRFTNAGFKLRPVAVAVPVGGGFTLDVAYNLRLYPNGFTASDFNKAPVPVLRNRSEAVHSISFDVRF